jgi:hypothetical protein
MRFRKTQSAVSAILLWATSLLAGCSTAHAWSTHASRTERDVRDLAMAIQTYHNQFGRFPAPDDYWTELLRAGMLEPNETERPMDQWGRSIIYRVPGKHGAFDVYSYGQDGVDNDGKFDDISSWAEVNDGFYWKTTWPRGRFSIVFGFALGLGCLSLARVYPRSIVVPLAGSLMCLGVALGCHWLMHPGIVPSRNDPLSMTGVFALSLMIMFLSYLIFPIVRGSNDPEK